MPEEFRELVKDQLEQGKDKKEATRMASIVFWKIYGTTPRKADKLEQEGRWNPDMYRRMSASGVLKKPNSILLIGDINKIDELKNVTGLFPVDEEHFDNDKIGAEFIVRSSEDRGLLLDSATNLGLATSVSSFSSQPVGMASGYKNKSNGIGCGWHGDSRGHSRAGKKGWRNRR